MGYRRIYPKDHDEWLKLRSTGIGSSDVGTILGVNPFDTPYKLWLRKRGELPPIEENLAMRLGHILEPAVAQLYEESTGNMVQKDTEGDWCAKSDKKDFLIASPDRICTDKEGGDILLECKTTRRAVNYDNIPASWICQVQYLMYITELDNGAIAWLKDGHDFGYKNMTKNEEFCGFIIEKVERFWVDCIIGGQEPQAINGDDILLKFPQTSKGKIIQATDEIRNSFDRLNELQKQITLLTSEKDTIIDKMKVATADGEKLMFGDKLLGKFRGGEKKIKETFDIERFKEENPQLYNQYMSVSEGYSSRTFCANYTK